MHWAIRKLDETELLQKQDPEREFVLIKLIIIRVI